MGRKMKRWLITAAALVLVGLLICMGALMMAGWNVGALGFMKYDTATYQLDTVVRHVTVDTNTARVAFVKTHEPYGRIVCYEQEKQKHTVSTDGDELIIRLDDQRRWFERLFSFGSPNITVYLPEDEYGALNIRSSTGDVSLPADFAFDSVTVAADTGDVSCEAAVSGDVNIALSTGNIRFMGKTAGSLALTVSTGHITVENTAVTGDVSAAVSTGKTAMTNVTCDGFTSTGSTGDIVLTDVVASGTLSVERDTGDVKFERCDAAELDVKTDTGDVTGSLRSDKIFFAKSDTGRVDVPETLAGGKCKVETDTGKIVLTVG